MRFIIAAAAIATLTACAAPLAQADRNKTIARRAFSEILEKGHMELVGEFYAPDFRNHGVNRDATLAEDMAALRALRAVSPPDATMRPEIVVAEGEYVSVLWMARGTLARGPMAMRGVTIWRIVDGRIRDEWSEFDEPGMLRELGLSSEEIRDAMQSAAGAAPR